MAVIAALVCGLVFGLGLVISGMSQPAKVLGFLDIFGAFDPTLLVVLAAALIVVAPGYALARRREKPILAARSAWPTRTAIDGRLVAGAVLFGVGWGLVGLCPGPAIVNLATLSPAIIMFVTAMGLGMLAHDVWQARPSASQSPARTDS